MTAEDYGRIVGRLLLPAIIGLLVGLWRWRVARRKRPNPSPVGPVLIGLLTAIAVLLLAAAGRFGAQADGLREAFIRGSTARCLQICAANGQPVATCEADCGCVNDQLDERITLAQLQAMEAETRRRVESGTPLDAAGKAAAMSIAPTIVAAFEACGTPAHLLPR